MDLRLQAMEVSGQEILTKDKNTAKLMEDNPTLLRLKELETLEKVTAKIERLTVFGGLEGVLKELVSLKTTAND